MRTPPSRHSPQTRVRRAFRRLPLFALPLILAACGGAQPGATGGATHAATAPGGSVCQRHLIDASQLGGLVDAPITGTKPLEGDPQTCYFVTAGPGGAQVMIALRPGLGRATLQTFTSGHMNDYAQWAPLAGVGDEAIWMPALREVEAQRNDVLCNARVDQPARALVSAGEAALQQRIGAVCNAVFAALAKPPAS